MSKDMFGVDMLVRKAFRYGAIPGSCLGASLMLSFYGSKVFLASNQWAEVGGSSSNFHAAELRQHAATVGAMAITSGAIGMEAVRDWLEYSGGKKVAEMAEVAEVFSGKRLFVMRPMVFIGASIGFGGAFALTGAIRFTQPSSSRPPSPAQQQQVPS